MITTQSNTDNIIPREMENTVRKEPTRFREIGQTLRSAQRANERERKTRLDLDKVEQGFRSNLSQRYMGKELERRVARCMERAKRPSQR